MINMCLNGGKENYWNTKSRNRAKTETQKPGKTKILKYKVILKWQVQKSSIQTKQFLLKIFRFTDLQMFNQAWSYFSSRLNSDKSQCWMLISYVTLVKKIEITIPIVAAFYSLEYLVNRLETQRNISHNADTLYHLSQTSRA